MARRQVNWAMLPFVVLVRLPILLPFAAVAWVGAQAERAAGWLGRRLPGLDR